MPKKKNRTMASLVKEYNKVTGKKVEKFASIAIGERRLAAAKMSVPPKAAVKPRKTVAERPAKAKSAAPKKVKVTVNGKGYTSVQGAFTTLRLPFKALQRLRKELKEKGAAEFEGYKFKVAK